jgi:hypothetical protein
VSNDCDIPSLPVLRSDNAYVTEELVQKETFQVSTTDDDESSCLPVAPSDVENITKETSQAPADVLTTGLTFLVSILNILHHPLILPLSIQKVATPI